MKIEILGTGCVKCKTLEKNVRDAVKNLNKNYTIEKVEDIQKIMEYGIISTPALVVDGIVKSKGKVLTKDEIIDLL